MMNTSQDPPLNENHTLYWVFCSEKWQDLVIIAVPEFNTIPTENNYWDVSTQDIKNPTLTDHIVNAESHKRNLKE